MRTYFVETFHWSKAYNCYSDIPIKAILRKRLRASGLMKVGCILEVFQVPNFCVQSILILKKEYFEGSS